MDKLNLYILVRTDMKSMTIGRGAAQVAHAQSEFHHWEILAHQGFNKISSYWYTSTANFGTVIVLGVDSLELLYQSIETTKDYLSSIYLSDITYPTGITHDPEYRITDGFGSHIVNNVPTCGWALLPEKVGQELFEQLPLWGYGYERIY